MLPVRDRGTQDGVWADRKWTLIWIGPCCRSSPFSSFLQAHGRLQEAEELYRSTLFGCRRVRAPAGPLCGKWHLLRLDWPPVGVCQQ